MPTLRDRLTDAGYVEVCVCNAAHMRNAPGRKRDVTDCQWIALRFRFLPG